jgi:hypothetical protein
MSISTTGKIGAPSEMVNPKYRRAGSGRWVTMSRLNASGFCG